MDEFTPIELDEVLGGIIAIPHGWKDVDFDVDPNSKAYRHLVNLGLLSANTGNGFGNARRVSATAKGRELYAKGGLKGERKKEVIETIWKAIGAFKP